MVDWQSLGPYVIGVDEVGRGCLAGPVYAAAVLYRQGDEFHPVTDSKKLSEQSRDLLSDKIKQSHFYSIASASVEEIDEINILRASLLAMKRAVEDLLVTLPEIEKQRALQGLVVVDGNKKIPHLESLRQMTLIKGDLRCAPVSAASIIAKVARDQLMKDHEVQYPGYGFAKHKGYLTLVHREALAQQGPCSIHRKTFAGVKELL